MDEQYYLFMTEEEKIIWENAWIIRAVANISDLYIVINGTAVKTP